jgi:hypothetical protein
VKEQFFETNQCIRSMNGPSHRNIIFFFFYSYPACVETILQLVGVDEGIPPPVDGIQVAPDDIKEVRPYYTLVRLGYMAPPSRVCNDGCEFEGVASNAVDYVGSVWVACQVAQELRSFFSE